MVLPEPGGAPLVPGRRAGLGKARCREALEDGRAPRYSSDDRASLQDLATTQPESGGSIDFPLTHVRSRLRLDDRGIPAPWANEGNLRGSSRVRHRASGVEKLRTLDQSPNSIPELRQSRVARLVVLERSSPGA